MVKITESNIYEKGMLISLHTGTYGGRKSLDEDQLKDLPKEIIHGSQDMFDKEYRELLKDIAILNNEYRSYVKRRTVPFMLDGIYFVKSEQLDEIIEYLETAKEKREELIKKAIEAYDEAIKRYKEKYPEFYERAKGKYPTKEALRERFYFRYTLMRVSPPTKDSLVSGETYKREMAKFKETIEEMKKDVVSIVAENILYATKQLKRQCTDGKPSQRTLNNLNKILSNIDEIYSDFIDRKDLKEVINKVRASVLDVDASTLRDNEDFKKEFKKEICKVTEEIKNLPDLPLKRAIDF